MGRVHGRLVIGIGNPMRGDDGAGPAVVERLGRLALTGTAVTRQSGEGLLLIESWKEVEQVIVIDALSPAGAPGTVRRIDVGEVALPEDFQTTSTHGFGLGAAIELSRALGQLPASTVVFGVEGIDFSLGSGLSPAVAAAVPELVEAVAEEAAGRNDGELANAVR